ncbi:MAG: hypothetical protein KDG51_17850, partial [Calditrichaeota bacterium]|nr:hypothetical protein [Calditrichota bacterium]
PENHVITADIIRNPLADDTAVENIFIRKREPVFINAFGLNRSQLAAIRKLFSYSGKHAAPEAPEQQPADDPQPEAVPERVARPAETAAEMDAPETAAEISAEMAAEMDAPEAPPVAEPAMEAEEERSERVIIRYHDRERGTDDEDDRPARPPQKPAETAVAEAPEIPDEIPAQSVTETPPDADEASKPAKPGVDLNKIISYIMKHNELILQRMWER